jgi:hypothetical protein
MYTALSAEKREIRLLRVLRESSQVACEYSSISLLDNPVYNALSYVWGDPAVTTPILVNGEVFHVTKNLAAALRVFGEKSMEDLLWVDAICIDQNSVDEKNQQLPLMRDIYVKAQKTLAWFGDGGEAGKGEAPAFRLIRRWAAAWEEVHNLVHQDVLDLCKRRGMHIGEMTKEHILLDVVAELNKLHPGKMGNFLGHKLGDGFDMSEYSAFKELGRHDYWNRIWIVQEFVLPKDVVLLLGHDKTNYDLFFHGYIALKNYLKHGLGKTLQKEQLRVIANFLLMGVQSLMDLGSRWLEREPGTDCSLWELININIIRKSLNPLNAVYGLLGLVSSPEAPIIVDYSTSSVKLFTDLTLNFIAHPSVGLDILSLIGTPFSP